MNKNKSILLAQSNVAGKKNNKIPVETVGMWSHAGHMCITCTTAHSNEGYCIIQSMHMTCIKELLKGMSMVGYHTECWCTFLLRTDRTSCVNLSASRNGRRSSNAVSEGSENHDLIGMAFSGERKYKHEIV